MEIIFPSPLEHDLHRHLFASDEEACALLSISPALRGGRARHLVRTAFLPAESDYVSRSPSHAALQPAFYVPIVTRSAKEHADIAFVHSQPFADDDLAFSPVDDEGERVLNAYLQRRVPRLGALAIVCSATRRVARHLAADGVIPSSTLGSTIERDAPGVTTHYVRSVKLANFTSVSSA